MQKPSKIMESNHSFSTAKATTTVSPSATSTRLLNPPRGWDSTLALASLFSGLTTLSMKTCFLISNLNLAWCNLRPFPQESNEDIGVHKSQGFRHSHKHENCVREGVKWSFLSWMYIILGSFWESLSYSSTEALSQICSRIF